MATDCRFELAEEIVRHLADSESIRLLHFLLGYLSDDEKLPEGIALWLKHRKGEKGQP